MQTIDPDCVHIPRLVDLVSLPGREDDDQHFVCSIFEAPGKNYLKDLTNFAWLGPARVAPLEGSEYYKRGPEISEDAPLQCRMPTFIDFAIGACDCLEMLHHGLKVVHGELRVDAFHFNRETGAVKLINLGAGPRSFEHGLTSSRWLALTKETGVKHKLQFIAPEQTGRMPVEPDSRTDIYSLGIIFFTLLTGRPAFEGETPLDVIQALLSKRLPLVSSLRLDVPNAVSGIIQRMTQKQTELRYHSITGLKYDLDSIRTLLGEGNSGALDSFQLGTKDVSAFFVLPTRHFGREEAQHKLHSIIDKVVQRQRSADPTMTGTRFQGAEKMSAAASSVHRDSLELMTRSSDASSVTGHSPALEPHRTNSIQGSLENGIRLSSSNGVFADNQTSLDTNVSSDSQKSNTKHSKSSNQVAQERRNSRRRHPCEVVLIQGAAGVGKSSLMIEVQERIRNVGYYGTAKFDPDKKTPFGPILQAMSFLFRQIFSESDLDTDYHRRIANGVRPYWAFAASIFDLPDTLLWDTRSQIARNPGKVSQHKPSSREPQVETTQIHNSLQNGRASSVKFISVFVEILRVLSSQKIICLCIDNIHHADDESVELLSTIMEKQLGIIILVSILLFC